MESKQVIYQHYNTISMKSYIGLTTRGMNERWKQHLRDAFRTNNDGSFTSTVYFHKAIRKYPLDSWEHRVLYEYRDDGTELPIEEYEKFFIAKYDTFKNGYNSTLGGEGVVGLSREARRKARVVNRKGTTKGYWWDDPNKSWRVSLSYLVKPLHFGNFKLESDAKAKADYLMSLSDEELLKEYEEYKASRKKSSRGRWNVSHYFDKHKGKYRVVANVDGKKKYYGQYTNEQDAIDKSKEVQAALRNGEQ